MTPKPLKYILTLIAIPVAGLFVAVVVKLHAVWERVG